MLKDIILTHWHAPLSAIAFQKLLLENRNIQVNNHLDSWKNALTDVTLSGEESELLKTVILKIDSQQTEFSLDVFFSLTSGINVQYFNHRYALLKYLDSVTYEDTWNNFYRFARGSVVDLEDASLVSATLAKFFNVDEKPYTSLAIVMQKMQTGRVTKYIKQDGSCISVSHQKELLVTTPGSFTSQQVIWAKEFLSEKHPEFLKDLKEKHGHLTFIFEYVGPENQIVVFYPKTDLILLHAIDTRTGKILSVDEVSRFAGQYDFTMCPTVDLSIDQMVQDKDNPEIYSAESQEGWVIRIDNDEESLFVKLKCSDYVKMHRIISSMLNPKFILEILLDGTFDDVFSQIRSDGVKQLVIKIKNIILDWNRKKTDELKNLFENFQGTHWASPDIVSSYRAFENIVREKTNGLSKADSVRKFLTAFAKGKTTDPKEEILLKARILAEKKYDFSSLEDYDSYKSFVSNRVNDIINPLKQAIAEYVFSGEKDSVFLLWIEENFKDEFFITEGVEDLDIWEGIFEKNKDEYYRLSMIQQNKLTPKYYKIHKYCVKKRAYEQKVDSLIPSLKKSLFAHLFREGVSLHETFLKLADPAWIISDELYSFHLFKQEFEEKIVSDIFPSEPKDSINRIVKEFYLILRGFETDNSYEIAKEIFDQLEDGLKDQKAYFQVRGKFSGIVNRQIPAFYRDIFFKLFDLTEENRLAYVREIEFLNEANIVLHESKEILNESDIDFRSLRNILSELAVQE